MAVAYGTSHKIHAENGFDYFYELRDQGRLYVDAKRDRLQYFLNQHDTAAAAYILFDYQAASLIAKGHNLEIIVPKEGTLTFVKGLLSHKPLLIDQKTMLQQLRSSGYRVVLPEQSAMSLSLNSLGDFSSEADREKEEQYLPAVMVQDFDLFDAETMKVYQLIQRSLIRVDYLKSRVIGQDLLLMIVTIIVALVGSGNMARRVMQRGVHRALLWSGLITAVWLAVYIFKYLQGNSGDTIVRWCWYTYTGFELLLGLLLLRIAYASDHHIKDEAIPIWLKWLAVFDVFVALVPLTNDFHQLMFTFGNNFADAKDHYGYGHLYLFVMLVIFLHIFWAIGVLIYKAYKQGHLKWNIVVVLMTVLMFCGYIYAYIIGLPQVRKTSVVIAIVWFYFLFLEEAILCGLISSNRGYIDLFTHSNLAMKIFHKDGQVAYEAARSTGGAGNVMELQTAITGGYVVCYENVRELRQKKRELQLLSDALQRSYELLKQQEGIKRDYISLTTKKVLYEELEVVMASKKEAITKYMQLLQTNVSGEQREQAIHRLNLLACFLKKRCVMLLRGREHNRLRVGELRMAVEELRKYAEEAGLSCAVMYTLQKDMDTIQTLRLYDAMQALIEQSLLHSCPSVIFNFYEDGDFLRMTVLFEESYSWLFPVAENLRQRLGRDSLVIYLREGEDAASMDFIISPGGDMNG
jgi:hypothetical protein